MEPETLLRLRPRERVDLLCGGKWHRTWIASVALDGLQLVDPLPGEQHGPAGARLEARQSHERGEMRFRLILREVLPGSPPLLHTGLPGEVRRLQRRSLFRLLLTAPIRYRMAGEGETSLGRMRDLSGSGLRLMTGASAPAEGTALLLHLRLDGADLHLQGVVVRREEGAEEVGVRFVSPPPRAVDRIVAHLFREQRRRRQKGLL